MGICAVLGKIVMKSLSEKVIFGYILKRVSHVEMWEKSTPSRETSKDKDPEIIFASPISGKASVTRVE